MVYPTYQELCKTRSRLPPQLLLCSLLDGSVNSLMLARFQGQNM